MSNIRRLAAQESSSSSDDDDAKPSKLPQTAQHNTKKVYNEESKESKNVKNQKISKVYEEEKKANPIKRDQDRRLTVQSEAPKSTSGNMLDNSNEDSDCLDIEGSDEEYKQEETISISKSLLFDGQDNQEDYINLSETQITDNFD